MQAEGAQGRAGFRDGRIHVGQRTFQVHDGEVGRAKVVKQIVKNACGVPTLEVRKNRAARAHVAADKNPNRFHVRQF